MPAFTVWDWDGRGLARMEQAAELSTRLVLRAGMEHQLLPSGAADVPCVSLLALVVDMAGAAAALGRALGVNSSLHSSAHHVEFTVDL
jgi:hypothetical protein